MGESPILRRLEAGGFSKGSSGGEGLSEILKKTLIIFQFCEHA